MTSGSLSKGMATNKLPVFLLAGLANACTPPSIVSVCDMAVMSSIGGLGGASAMAAFERWRRTSIGLLNVLVRPRDRASMAWRSCSLSAPLIKPEQRSPADIAAALVVGSTQEIPTPTARHQEAALFVFCGRPSGD